MKSIDEKRAAIIHRKAWYAAHREGDEAFLEEISESGLEDVIVDVAGADPRTIEKYMEKLENDGRIEKPFREGFWKITEPPSHELFVNTSSKQQRGIRVYIPSYINDLIDKYNMNKEGLMTRAVLEDAGLKRTASEDLLREYSHNEIDYMFHLISQDLHKRGVNSQDEHMKTEERTRLYKEVVGKTDNPYEEAGKLRKRAFKLAEQLGVEGQSP